MFFLRKHGWEKNCKELERRVHLRNRVFNMMYHKNDRNEVTDPTPNPSPTREGSAYGVPSGGQGGSSSPPFKGRGWGWGL